VTSKSSGLGQQLWVGGYDLSGDIGSLSKISGSLATLDVTAINQSAHQRIGGMRDGAISFTSFFDTAAGQEHAVLSPLPTADVLITLATATTIGSSVVSQNSKQVNYDPSRGTDGSLTFGVDAQANGFGQEWGILLTPGLRTDTAATNGAAYDAANGLTTPAVPASGTPAVNTGFIPVTVVVSGGTVSNVVVNGVSVGTGDGTYTVPATASITLTYSAAPTWTWTPTSAYGAQAYLQVTAFTGTDVTVTLQDSADNSSWTNIASGAFAQTTAANTTQRLALTNTATVRRYVRAITSTVGGFTTVTFGVQLTRNLVAGQVF
jgi:hypothetical protein